MLYIIHYKNKDNLYIDAKTLSKMNKKVFTIERELDEILYDVIQFCCTELFTKENAIKQAQRHNAEYILIEDTKEDLCY